MRTMRELLEQREKTMLRPEATFAADSRGRLRDVPPCPHRTCFQRDRDRIIHTKAFRRLSHKTQVFISPEGDHYRDRLTHTLEVTQIARTIARALQFNEDLTEAIALGHDLGHTPFGHTGERVLNDLCGFRHNEQSLRVVDHLERNGEGLNLSWEVRNGIVCHTGSRKASTPEGRIVHFADRIAYINHDIDDAIRAGLLVHDELPRDALAVLGDNHGDRIDTMVTDMIRFGQEQHAIGMYPAVHEAMMTLRAYLFDYVYSRANGDSDKVNNLIGALFSYFLQHIEELPEDYQVNRRRDSDRRIVCDYIAGMTDRFAVAKYTELFLPQSWNIK